MTQFRLATGNASRHPGVLLAVVALHTGFLALLMFNPPHWENRIEAEKPPLQLPVPLRMMMVKVIATPRAVAGASQTTPNRTVPVEALPTPAPPTPRAVKSATSEKPLAASPTIQKQPSPKPMQEKAKASPTISPSNLPVKDEPSPISLAASSTGNGTAAGKAEESRGQSVGSSQHAARAGSSKGAEIASAAGTSTGPSFGAAYLNNPAPDYPTLAKRLGQQGKVLLRVLVTANGLAKEVRLFHSCGAEMLDKSAIRAVKHWRFIPARQGDENVEAWVQVPIMFQLN